MSFHRLTAEDYIGSFEEVDDHRSGKIVIQLNGRLNKTGCINPRYNVQLRDMEKWVVKLLPSRQFGYIVLTTSAGIVSTTSFLSAGF
jgi:small subunit ribosomal protein S15Ae